MTVASIKYQNYCERPQVYRIHYLLVVIYDILIMRRIIEIKCEIQLSIKTMFQCNKPRSSIKHIWLPNRISILTRATNERNK